MKKSIFLLLSAFSLAGCVQNKNQNTMESKIQAIEDKMAIKQVVDVFSNLADTKEIDKQVLLFTEDGVVESYADGQQTSSLKGREQLKQTFSSFLSNFHTIYHQNGQQTIDELTENTAKTTSYCQVILIGKQDGKEMKTQMFTIYKDELEKQNGQWLIKHRTSNFVHRVVEEVK